MNSIPLASRFALLVSLTLAPFALAQNAPASVVSTSSANTDEIVTLGVFEVSADKDRGYATSHAVGATRMAVPLKEIPQAITVLNEKLIRDLRPDYLSEIVKYVGGVTETASPGRDIFVIRGVQISGPFFDGLPEAGSSQGSGIDMSLLSRVEVLKGPSAVIYGSTSSGGVVNRTMKKPFFERARRVLDLEAGSFEHYRATLDVNQPFGPKNAFAVRLVGSYWNLGGEQNFSYKHRRFLAPMFGWKITPDTVASITVVDFYDRYHKAWGQAFTLPPYVGNNLTLSTTLGLPRDRAWAEPYSVQFEQSRRYSLLVDHKVNEFWGLRLSAMTSTYNYQEDPTTIPRDLLVQNGRLVMQRSWRITNNPTEATSLALDSAWKFKVGPTRHSLIALVQRQKGSSETFGWNGRNAANNATNVLPLLDILNPVYGGGPDNIIAATNTLGKGESWGYAVQEQAYFFEDKLILQAGVRYNQNKSQGHNRLTNIRDNPPEKTKWTPRYGVVYRFTPGVSGYYSRSETFTPIFSANPDGRTFSPPTSEQDEVGAKFDILKGKISATLAYYKRTNLNTITNDPDPIRASAGYRIQIAGDELEGYEADIYINPIPELQIIIGGSKMDAKNLSGLLTRDVPKNQGSVLARYEFSQGPLKGLGIGAGYVSRGRRPGDTGNTFWLPKYNSFDAFATYTWQKYSFNLRVDNLEDEYYLHSAINRNIINAGPPRGATLRVSREF
jgi:iron complex outermembrane receptor protein